MNFNAFQVVAFVYCGIAISFALILPYENTSTVVWRIVAVIAIVFSIRFRDAVTAAFLGSNNEANWFVFIPATLFLVIVFGSLYTAEQREILFGNHL